MNWIQFGRLIHSIYRRGGPLPDLDWIQRLGLLAIKLGQVHALRIDFLDREKCEHLARLYRRNLAVPGQNFIELLEDKAVAGFLEQVGDIDANALASASVGQVHRARLASGEEVVIKAVKAGIRDKFVDDVKGLKRLMRISTRVVPRLARVGDPVAIVEDVETYTLSELDLENEVAGQQRLIELRDSSRAAIDMSRLRFPRVYRHLSNSDVMVSEFVDAPTADELLERNKLEYEQVIELFRIHGYCMLKAGVFHGDLHPGNVLIDDDACWFIDTGYVAEVSECLRQGLYDFFLALSFCDYRGCVQALRRMSVVKLEDEKFARFTRQFEQLYQGFEGATVSEVSLTQKMMQSIRLAVEAGMSFERDMFSIIRSLMYMDGMVLRCNPGAVLVRDMRPVLEEFA